MGAWAYFPKRPVSTETVKVLPAPGLLSKLMPPPNASDSVFEILNPRPVPPNRRDVEASACVKGSKIVLACSSAMADACVSDADGQKRSIGIAMQS